MCFNHLCQVIAAFAVSQPGKNILSNSGGFSLFVLEDVWKYPLLLLKKRLPSLKNKAKQTKPKQSTKTPNQLTNDVFIRNN